MTSLDRHATGFFPVVLSPGCWGRWPEVHNTTLLVSLALFGVLTALWVNRYFVA